MTNLFQMKNSFKETVVLLVLLSCFAMCGMSQNLSSALSDIKRNKVTSNTIATLERASQKSGDEAESYYNLARIYHFNTQFANLNQARFYYQKVLSMYQMSSYSGQMKILQKNYGIDENSLRNSIKDVDELICNKAFSDCLKENTLNGYVLFANKYPTSVFVNTAKDKALALQESLNTIAGYADYRNAFPGYRQDEVVQKALNVAKRNNTMDSFREFQRLFPNNNTREIDQLALKAAIAQNKFTTFSEFQSNFPNLCSDITKTIDFMEKEPLDQKGQNTLRALKMEYFSSSTDLASLNAAVKRYPIISFNYNDRYYESQSSFNAQMAELNRMKSTLPDATIQRLQQAATNRQNQFITSDWKGNPSMGKQVVNGYPNLASTVAGGLYQEIAGMRVQNTNYASDHNSYSMKSELDDLGRQIQFCDDFISGFGNASYAGQARDKRNALANRKSYVEKQYDYWVSRVEYAKNRLKELKNEILAHGKTPQYKKYYERDNKYVCEMSLKLYAFDDYNGINCQLILHKNTGKYSAYIGGGKLSSDAHYKYDDGHTTEVGLAIREALWASRYYEYEDLYLGRELIIFGDEKYHRSEVSGDAIINLVDFLEKNKNGDWWKY